MSIPDYEDRIRSRYGEMKTVLEEKINRGILNGEFKENSRGNEVITVRLEDGQWPDDELQRYMEKAYNKKGWSLDFKRDWDDDQRTWIEVCRYS